MQSFRKFKLKNSLDSVGVEIFLVLFIKRKLEFAFYISLLISERREG